MEKFECESCENALNATVLYEGVEVCPKCKSESVLWTTEGMKTADYWEKAWTLKRKHNKLINDIKNSITMNV